MFKRPFNNQDSTPSQANDLLAEKIRERFGKYGDEVVSLMTELARSSARMSSLFDRLELAPKPDLTAQLDALDRFIVQKGVERFIRRGRHELWREVQKKEQTEREENERDGSQKKLQIARDSQIHEPPRKSSAAVINVPGYSGSERRTGVQDRRSHRDRRCSIRSIKQNKRLGQDRRMHPRGRRKLDLETATG
ncbi:hypothetical protein HYR69_08070 [Candidatus Sumerlaeota bacterium]|nr:hypothetical protein [Candidatus Sumerlaeota bacterium]